MTAIARSVQSTESEAAYTYLQIHATVLSDITQQFQDVLKTAHGLPYEVLAISYQDVLEQLDHLSLSIHEAASVIRPRQSQSATTTGCLDWSKRRDITNKEALEALDSLDGPIHTVNLRSCINISDQTLLAIAERCSHITFLDLSFLDARDETLLAFINKCQDNGVTHLGLRCTQVSDSTCRAAVTKCRDNGLLFLDLGGSKVKIRDETLRDLLPKCCQKEGAKVNINLKRLQGISEATKEAFRNIFPSVSI